MVPLPGGILFQEFIFRPSLEHRWGTETMGSSARQLIEDLLDSHSKGMSIFCSHYQYRGLFPGTEIQILLFRILLKISVLGNISQIIPLNVKVLLDLNERIDGASICQFIVNTFC